MGEKFCVALREVQYRSKCATKTLKMVLEAAKEHFGAKDLENLNLSMADNAMKNASGATCLQLHGCVGCHHHIFVPRDRSRHCPKCNHPRRNASNQPNEVGSSTTTGVYA